MHAVIPTSTTPADLAALADLAAEARAIQHAAHAPNTRRAYGADWRDFVAWCERYGYPSLPADGATVCLYLTELSRTRKQSTVKRRISAIAKAHQLAGHDSPTRDRQVRDHLRGLRRTYPTAETGKEPTLTEDLRAMVATCGSDLLGLRNRALLLLGFAGAFRRSELVALDLVDLNFTRDGCIVTIRRSKTDQEAQGAEVGIPYGSKPDTCPVRALRDWIDAARITEGPLFRSFKNGRLRANRTQDRTVAEVVKAAAAAAGLDPARLAGHSLRSGLATSAARRGVSERAIMAQGRWKNVNVARRYIRRGTVFSENAASDVGL